jgi:hypothetical protein
MIHDGNLDAKYRLKVKDYKFSVDRELRGSLDYINDRLEPKGKKTRLIFWSGDCLPREQVLAYVYKNDFLQINGGDTIITNSDPWLSLVAPLGIRRGSYYQIFTGAQNENVYTNDWHGPYWGFKKVIQTFQLTDSPRRLKPVDVYYHFYTGSKRASLKALETVYDWVTKQESTPIYTSSYIPIAMDYFDISLARDGGDWLVRGTRSLKTLRIPASLYPDYSRSEGVVGDRKYLEGRYLHLDTREEQRFRLGKNPVETARLEDANAIVTAYSEEKESRKISLVSQVALKLRVRVPQGCSWQTEPKADEVSRKGDIVSINYHTRKDANVTLSCN